MDSTSRRPDPDWVGIAQTGVQVRSIASDSRSVKHAVRESMPTVEFAMEESPEEDHQSNGTIEVVVREIQKTNQSDDELEESKV